MRGRKLSIGLTLALAMFAATTSMTATLAAAQSETRMLAVCVTAVQAFFVVFLLLASTSAMAHTETVLFNFSVNSGGNSLQSTQIFDSAGNIYGTTAAGGSGVFGTLFEIAHEFDSKL